MPETNTNNNKNPEKQEIARNNVGAKHMAVEHLDSGFPDGSGEKITMHHSKKNDEIGLVRSKLDKAAGRKPLRGFSPSLRKKPPTKGLSVEHHVPGRTRLRIHKQHAHPEKIEHMKRHLTGLPGVEKVEYNYRTGSFLVHHGEHPEMFDVLSEASAMLATQLFEFVVEAEEIEIAGLFILGGFLVSRIAKTLQESIQPEKKPGVVHTTKGRTKLKVHRHHRNHEHLSDLKSRIESVEGIDNAYFNHRTGTVVFHHDSSHDTMQKVGEILKDFSEELFDSLLVKGESPKEAGLHLVAHTLLGTSIDSGSEKSGFPNEKMLATAGLLAAFFIFKRV